MSRIKKGPCNEHGPRRRERRIQRPGQWFRQGEPTWLATARGLSLTVHAVLIFRAAGHFPGGARIAAGVVADRHPSADHMGNATGFLHHDRPWHTLGHGLPLPVPHGLAGGVGDTTGPDFTHHLAGGVRDGLLNGLTLPVAHSVRNPLGDAAFHKVAGGVRDFAASSFLDHRADGVRDATGAGLRNHRASGVRNPLGDGVGNPGADRVRDLFGSHAGFVPHAADRLHFHFRAPDFAADGVTLAPIPHQSTARGAGVAVATRFAGALVSAPFLRAAVRGTLSAAASGNAFPNRLPVTPTDRDHLGFNDGFANRVADIPVAGVRFDTILSAADFAVAGLVNWLIGGLADRFVTGFGDRTIHRVAMLAVAGFVNRLADSAGFGPVTGAVHGPTDRAEFCLVAGFVNRPTDCVFLLPVAGFVHNAGARNPHLLGAGVVHSHRAAVLFGLPDHFLHGFELGAAAAFGHAESAPGSTGFCRTAVKTVRAAVGGLRTLAECTE